MVLVVTWAVASWPKLSKPRNPPLNRSVFPPSSVMDGDEDEDEVEDEDEDEEVTEEEDVDVGELMAVPGFLETVAGDVLEPSSSRTKLTKSTCGQTKR